MALAFIGIGSNLGDRDATVRSALAALRAIDDQLVTSSLYETDPVGYTDQPPFLNAVALLETDLGALDLLGELKRIEAAHQRVRHFRNAPRTLDLDLLLYNNAVIETSGLSLPHPRMHERAFVLVPLAEIAPNAWHPILNRTAAEMLTDLGAVEGIVKWSGDVSSERSPRAPGPP
jgi:2-amino-4-hydroxy-6-hydroxymethyldihydropteridine diphosphokinase